MSIETGQTMQDFFKSVTIKRHPKSKCPVVFQCDDNFFDNFGRYNLLSCNKHKQDVHIHLINPSNRLLKNLENANLDIDLGYSFENIDTSINRYKLKSYYFCARYFVANLLFECTDIEGTYITDADIVFNKKVTFDKRVSLGMLYYPGYDNLWKQTGANFTYVRKDRKNFLENVITEYKDRLKTTDFNSITEDMDKITKANLYALDQVCMSTALKQEKSFTNLTENPNFISKDREKTDIWSLTGGNQKYDTLVHMYLKDKFSDDLQRINKYKFERL